MFKPKHTVSSVARHLEEGLRDGSINMENDTGEKLPLEHPIGKMLKIYMERLLIFSVVVATLALLGFFLLHFKFSGLLLALTLIFIGAFMGLLLDKWRTKREDEAELSVLRSHKQARALSDQFYEKLSQLKYPMSNQVSSVGCAIGDLYESFWKIYEQLLPTFFESEKLDQNLDSLIELKLEFDHIQAHLKESEAALLDLIRFVDEVSESDVKG